MEKFYKLDFIINFIKYDFYYYIKRLTKRYYIIRRPAPGAGFFSNYYWVMGHVVFAKKFGYIPVVDMLNYSTLYSEKKPVKGEMNAWNYYFENVGKVNLQDAYESKRYVLGEEKYLSRYAEKFCKPYYRFPSNDTITYYNKIINKSIKIKKDILDDFEAEWKKNISEKGKVIGIHIRGTDMKNNLGHPVPAGTVKYLDTIKEILCNEKEIKYIFIASDELRIIEELKKEFKGKGYHLIINNAFRSEEQKNDKKIGLHEMKVDNERNNHKYRLGLEVLKDAFFLAKCDYLVCGHSNITNISIIWNNKQYKKVICLDK